MAGLNGDGAGVGKKKILPDLGEDENPFASGPGGLDDQANHQQIVDARKSKLSVVHQKSKSLMNQLNKIKDDAIHNFSQKDLSEASGEASSGDQRALKFDPSGYSNSFVIASDPKLSEDHKQELTRKQTAGSMIGSFITKKREKRNSMQKIQRARVAEVNSKVEADIDMNAQ